MGGDGAKGEVGGDGAKGEVGGDGAKGGGWGAQRSKYLP